jgi:hypothetical protein
MSSIFNNFQTSSNEENKKVDIKMNEIYEKLDVQIINLLKLQS